MNKRIFLIHGWEGHPEEGWRPWLRKELEKRNCEVFVPEMPDTNFPKMNGWLSKLKEVVGVPDENVYLVGHSLGCIAILRYLESFRPEERVGGVILVAGFTDDLGFKELSNFFETPINFEEIKKHCQNFMAIHSDNDQYVPLKYGDIFKEKLNAKVIVEHGMKHFSGDDGITELPVVLKEIIKSPNSTY
jgi:predicted alpha/beta hydrolase family esterase